MIDVEYAQMLLDQIKLRDDKIEHLLKVNGLLEKLVDNYKQMEELLQKQIDGLPPIYRFKYQV